MQTVMFLLGVLFALAGGFLLLHKDSGKTGGALLLFTGFALLILGSDLGQHVRTLKVSEAGVEVSFSAAPTALTPQQVVGAQKAQELRLAPALPPAAVDSEAKAAASRIFATYKDELDTLHRSLTRHGYTPVPNPSMDLNPGTVVSIAPQGEITIRFKQQDAFPELKSQSSALDLVQFISGKTRTGSGAFFIGSFACVRGFREDMPLLAESVTRIAPAVDDALKRDASLQVVRSVVGCYGEEKSVLAKYFSDRVRTRVNLGFQITTPIRH